MQAKATTNTTNSTATRCNDTSQYRLRQALNRTYVTQPHRVRASSNKG